MLFKACIAVSALAAAVVAQSTVPGVLYSCPASDDYPSPLCFAVPAAQSASGNLECYYSFTEDLSGCVYSPLENCIYDSQGVLQDTSSDGFCFPNAVSPLGRRSQKQARAPKPATAGRARSFKSGKKQKARRAQVITAQ